MFQKVHLRLTLLCAGITTIVMIIMSLAYLYVSENALQKSYFLSFSNDMNTMTASLGPRPVISFEWLARMEAGGKYSIFVLDNGTPFLYNDLNSSDENNARTLLGQETLQYYNQYIAQTNTDETTQMGNYSTVLNKFTFVSPTTGKSHYGCFYSLETENGSTLQMAVAASLVSLEEQIAQQRLRFLAINLVAILFITVFSWFFTKILLKPIENNQKKQIQFVASASHELRTPLAVLLSCMERYEKIPSEKRKGLMQTMQSEAMRMSALLSDMLTLSQSDTRSFSIHKDETELDTLVLNSFEAFEAMALEGDISMSVKLPDKKLPSCMCDGGRISQVAAILLHNAISYTPAGGTITLSLEQKKHGFVITVTDNGTGISAQDKEKIFDRFYRAEKSRSGKGHFGLGLSIADEIVRAHQGSIQITDTPGGGASFHVYLPQ